MPFIQAKLTGVDKLKARLTTISRAGQPTAIAATSAGLDVLKKSAVDASPGTVKREIGKYLIVRGNRVSGRAGLMRLPKRGQQQGPHGVYLERGTKFIQARHFVARALRQALPRARAAANRAASGRLSKAISE